MSGSTPRERKSASTVFLDIKQSFGPRPFLRRVGGDAVVARITTRRRVAFAAALAAGGAEGYRFTGRKIVHGRTIPPINPLYPSLLPFVGYRNPAARFAFFPPPVIIIRRTTMSVPTFLLLLPASPPLVSWKISPRIPPYI